MNPIDPSKFSLDYLLENELITILSQDYVIEHGTNWDEVAIEELIMNRLKYMCYPDYYGNPDYCRRFSGVLYQLYNGKPTVVSDTLQKKDKVQLIGFGTFETAERAARTGRNPANGEAIKIAASTLVKFKAGTALKEKVNTKPAKKSKKK